MGGTLILPTVNAGKDGECARGMAGLVVLSTGRSRRLPGTCLGWNPRLVGRSWSGPAYRVTASSRCREGRRVAELCKRAERTVLADVRKEKYDAREAA